MASFFFDGVDMGENDVGTFGDEFLADYMNAIDFLSKATTEEATEFVEL